MDMEVDNNQFDAAVGGKEGVPPEVSLKPLANTRIQEIIALNNALSQAQKGGLIFQRLPKSMRRRVMSHNTKRVPRRLREAHAKQLEKHGAPVKSKPPTRKFRRRPQNLLLEYNRRQKDYVWMETHIWHAKRFHMTSKWEYKLADFPNDKSFRACYRAGANHCLLQDISYHCCLELSGPKTKLLEGLQKHVSENCGLTFGAKAFCNGNKEGIVTLFQKEQFPFGAVGCVNFMWKPTVDPLSKEKVIWIWTHPAIYEDVCNIFQSTFALKPLSITDSSIVHNISSNSKPELKKLEPHHVLEEPSKFINASDGIIMVLLKDKLNRFRLTGPLSQAILADSLNVAPLPQEISRTEDNGIDKKCFPGKNTKEKTLSSDAGSELNLNSVPWWKEFYKQNEANKGVYSKQREFWRSSKNMYSPSELPPHQIIGLTIVDPRYQLPAKRTKIVPSLQDNQQHYATISNDISQSALWDADIRLQVTTTKLSNSELAKVRSSVYLLPGFTEGEVNGTDHSTLNSLCDNVDSAVEPSRLPIILIQRPGSQDSVVKRLGFNSGWDVILPAGWAMPFWLSFIFRGARPGGLRETFSLEFESCSGSYRDTFAPDTKAGQLEDNTKKSNNIEHHFRLPPNKRPNYVKLGIVSPFECCWQTLISDWCQNKHDTEISYYVLRDKSKLNALRSIVNIPRKTHQKNLAPSTPQISDFSYLFSNMNHNCLVAVTVENIGKGRPSDYAIICVPTHEDMKHLEENSKFEGPVEPSHEDEKAVERKSLRSEHIRKLKQLRKKRVHLKSKLEEKEDSEKKKELDELLKEKKENAKICVEEHAKKMQELWVPEVKTVKDSCSRTVLGFVCKGDFSFSEAQGIGFGFLPLSALVYLLNIVNNKIYVLIRNPQSAQYRFAILKIC